MSSLQTLKLQINSQVLGIGWTLDPTSGWGNYGTQLCINSKRSGILAIPIVGLNENRLSVLHKQLLRGAVQVGKDIARQLGVATGGRIRLDFPLVHATDARLVPTIPLWGSKNIGLTFFEGSNLSRAAVDTANQFDAVCAGSTWNEEILKSAGITRTFKVIQGIDPTVFHPAPATGCFSSRFVIFSGGKLEFRKGQDIVVAALRHFCRKHPETLLITSWHNHWPKSARHITQGGHVSSLPVVSNGKFGIKEWLVSEGLPANCIWDAGLVQNIEMASLIREANVALFPNRAEGGTNLVAMECMACGVPTILSANTGHLDLIDRTSANCYPLVSQQKVQTAYGFDGTTGWGESAPDEIIESLESVYLNRDESRKIGKAGSRFVLRWTWANQIKHLLGEIDRVCGN